MSGLLVMDQSSKDYVYREKKGTDVERTLMMVSTGVGVDNQKSKDEVSFFLFFPFLRKYVLILISMEAIKTYLTLKAK